MYSETLNMSAQKQIKETFKLALPIIGVQIGQVLFGVIDTLMVGRLGVLPLAGAAFVNNVISIPLIFLAGFTTAVSVNVSQNYGAGKQQEISRHLIHGLLGGFSLCALIVCGFIFLGFHLEFFQQPPEVIQESRQYFWYMSVSLLPLVLFFVFRQFFEAVAKPQVSVYATLLGLAANGFLNWTFIYGNLGAPEMGLDGAGLATVLARAVMVLVLVFYFIKSMKAFHLKRPLWGTFLVYFREQLKIGLPSGFQYLFEVGAFSGAGIMMGWLGAEALAAHQVALNLASLTFMVSLGIAFASSVRVGQSRGRGGAEIRDIGVGSFLISGIFMFFCGVIFILFGQSLAALYVKDLKVLALAQTFLYVTALFQIFDGTQAVGVSLLRGMSDVKLPTLITFVAYWVVSLPLGYFLAFSTRLGALGIWVGLAVGLAVASISLIIRFHILTKPNMSR